MSDSKRGRQIEVLKKQVRGVKDQLGKLEDTVNKNAKTTKDNREDFDNLLDTNILDALYMERFPGSGKPMYSYQEIANKFKVPVSRVQKVAELNGVRRIKDKVD